ncbi:stationary phase survival protein SurE [Actinomadura sp. LD22]|uniref:5'-nucleotidase n=1 Tax=Actinomadura physcomitrii TaxID=2650748 RepID=A0A6I4MGR5_9ACTN|nr:5'/3'-nucleotidase SurE [Actinomadura physcomitrii]MWA03197.1 stationary phase survival protein SurE [Actinomadura physcomitrii]
MDERANGLRRRRPGRGGRLAVAGLAAAVLAAAPASASAGGDRGHHAGPDLRALAGKRILLANDDSVQAARPDGADGRGLYALRKALCEAKADVVVVGPWAQQSGRSRASASSPQVTVAPPAAVPAQYAQDCSTAPSGGPVVGVCQGAGQCAPSSASVTPADAVDLALGAYLPQRIGWTHGPDLVLTGINSGANTDLSVNLSGTVGAAVAAVEHGVPAVAVSAGTRATSVPSDTSYQVAARYATRVAARLFARKATGRLARERLIININCPDVTAGVDPTPRWTHVGRVAVDRFSYTATGENGYRLGYGAVQPAPGLDPHSDTATLAGGHISIGAVTVDRDGSGAAGWARAVTMTG